MKSKEQVFKLIEGRIDTMQALTLECIELIYNAGFNDAIEVAASIYHESQDTDFDIGFEKAKAMIRKLKK